MDWEVVLILEQEWLRWKNPQTVTQLRHSLCEFEKWYNGEREHEALE